LNMIKKFVSSLVVIALILMTSGIINPFAATAAGPITTATDIMSRLKVSTASNHEIKFVSPSGIAGGQSVTLTFQAGFTGVSSILWSDVDFAAGDSNNCATANFTEKTLGSSAVTTTWGVTSSGQVITILSGTDTVTANKCLRIRIGTNAVSQSTGVNQISNGTIGNYTITIGGTFTDSGQISVALMDDDSVSVSASVNQTLTFDLNVGYSAGPTSPPYQVPLNTLSASSVSESNGTTIKTIFTDGGTNASGGMNVSVANANGNQGLKSTSVGTDYIGSTTGTMAVGTANYGLCVGTANLAGFAKSTTYNTTCAVNSGTNAVVGLSTTPVGMLTSSAPVATGHADIVVNAEISNATPAHSDYSDTLTFIATASY
jgi:hypothetical protein